MVTMATRATQENLAALLRRYRGRRGYTQEQLAEKAGLSVGEISRLERGVRRAPRVQTLYLLGGALRLSRAEQAALETALFRDAPRLRPQATTRVR
jgi:transcriptional regulator with XRE-family HTH domain